MSIERGSEATCTMAKEKEGIVMHLEGACMWADNMQFTHLFKTLLNDYKHAWL